jgi:hypothetical protein
MNLWTVREGAMLALEEEMVAERSLLDRAFQQAEYLAQRLQSIETTAPFGQITGAATAKARILGQACYSLVLDGIGQESGAIARVWLEAIDLLTYLYLDPSRTEEIFKKGGPPKAGKIAQEVKSKSGKARRYLNEAAAHLGFGMESWQHLTNWNIGGLRTRPQLNLDLLRRNLGDVFTMMAWTIRESAFCLNVAQGYVEEGIGNAIHDLKTEGFEIFFPGVAFENT